MVIPKKFKKICAACGDVNPKINKEHFWPEWLIERTVTHRTSIRFGSKKRINPRAFTVPLCIKCNEDFGRELEGPVSRTFTDLETGCGISDIEAELLVRWLWKFEGLYWIFAHPEDIYTERYTLRKRVLQPLDDIRTILTLAISLVEVINPNFGDAPMGIDSWNEYSAVFVAGVFSRVAIMVLFRQFEPYVPPQFSLYRFSEHNAPDRDAKLFYPTIGFRDCVEAVNVTKNSALYLSHIHDLKARDRTAKLTSEYSGSGLEI
ncbi:MAG: hypothetical protein HY356_00160 [Gammaproteobacteria bacterium]|nr:hypothetical protein [Gammaproteobacteria bacterium]